MKSLTFMPRDWAPASVIYAFIYGPMFYVDLDIRRPLTSWFPLGVLLLFRPTS